MPAADKIPDRLHALLDRIETELAECKRLVARLPTRRRLVGLNVGFATLVAAIAGLAAHVALSFRR